jgi:hypothetical protein
MCDHTAATAFRHSLAASARKIRSVDRIYGLEGNIAFAPRPLCAQWHARLDLVASLLVPRALRPVR